MTTRGPQTGAQAADLRRMFDQTFAEAPHPEAGPQEDFLAINIGGDHYAVRLHPIAGLVSDRKVTWLPGSVAELIGLIGLRGALVPVYDFRTLLGYPRGPVPRWFLIAAATHVAFAFDRFDAHLRVPREAVADGSAPGAAAESPYVREVLRTDEFVRPIIHMPAVLDAIAVLVRQAAPKGVNH